MPIYAADSIWVTSTTMGLTDFTVGAALPSYRTFATAAVPDGSTIHYSARTPSEFENGEGVYTSGVLTRVTIFASSNANAKVNFGALPTIAVTPLAEDAIFPPASSTDNAIVRWDGTAGDAVQSSTATVSDAGAIGTNVVGTGTVFEQQDGANGNKIKIVQNASTRIYELWVDPDGTGYGSVYSLGIGPGVAKAGGKLTIGNTAIVADVTVKQSGNSQVSAGSGIGGFATYRSDNSNYSQWFTGGDGRTYHLNGQSGAHVFGKEDTAAYLIVEASGIRTGGANTSMPANTKLDAYRTITFVIDGGGSTITTGIKGDLEIPFACTIDRVTALADQTGSISVGVWRSTYAGFPPVVGGLITTAGISATNKSQGTISVAIAAGDILRFNVDSVTTIQRVTVSLRCYPT